MINLSITQQRFLKEKNIEFVSLKYENFDGVLCQEDFTVQDIIDYSCLQTENLYQIQNGAFIDFFRSRLTYNIFCEKKYDLPSKNQKLVKYLSQITHNHTDSYIGKISYKPFTTNEITEDIFANMRSDAVLYLKDAGISAVKHYYDSERCIILIVIKNSLEIVYNYIIVKYILCNTAITYGMHLDYDQCDFDLQMNDTLRTLTNSPDNKLYINYNEILNILI